jgi:hypothetical protein
LNFSVKYATSLQSASDKKAGLFLLKNAAARGKSSSEIPKSLCVFLVAGLFSAPREARWKALH